MLQRNIQDTFNAAVGGFITVWFEGHEEEQAPTAMQVAIAETKRAQDRQKSPTESSRDRRKHGKSRAELDNAKRPFSFRSDPVNLAFGGIKAWGDVAAVAVRPQHQLPISSGVLGFAVTDAELLLLFASLHAGGARIHTVGRCIEGESPSSAARSSRCG